MPFNRMRQAGAIFARSRKPLCLQNSQIILFLTYQIWRELYLL
jgi:hypothetical protein